MNPIAFFGGDYYCLKHSKECQCEDCGSGSDMCRDVRCHDDKGYLKYNQATKKYDCFTLGTETKREEEQFLFCFSGSAKCDLSRCKPGQYMSECRKASAGVCKNCPNAGSAVYFSSPGNGLASCKQSPCDVAAAGFYTAKQCTASANSVIKPCAQYPGNKGSVKEMSAEQIAAQKAGSTKVFDIDRFYCPVGLALPLPVNAEATVDYTGFQCKAGYYEPTEQKGVCLACPAGSACMFGRKMQCPANYFSKNTASSACTRCTESCPARNRKPLRCNAGSTFDGGCVSCGACGYSEDTGLTCVENNYEMQSLKPECSPPSSGDWQCKNRG
jgi:hypothetical protein